MAFWACRWRCMHNFLCMKILAALLSLTLTASAELSDKELDSIGHRVWQNECAGTRDGLTSWNAGENFASLGIGHFIWYPRGVNGPFEESFPKLIKYLEAGGASVPGWAHGDCPWNTKAEFQKEFQSERTRELRNLMASTIRLQSRFLAERMEQALPKMLEAAPAAKRDRVKANFNRLRGSGAGTFALIDYVNFKGEGTNPAERYKGEGWGLLDVLMSMEPGGGAGAFAQGASEVLERRVRNSPPERNESRWLPGWKARVRAYAG
ncbi:MAG: hypothetical protein JWL59_510 [Chthoniobacteraceae bacterium]|nr:hypothetical protein [Chthoniobacteraceae bacterium]